MSPDSGTDLVSEGPELALLGAGIDAGFHRGLVPDRARAAARSRPPRALPEDCGRLPPLVAFCASSSDIVRGSLVTVMSAPIRVSQNEDTDCFTVTAEEPFALAFDDQSSPSLAAAWRALLGGHGVDARCQHRPQAGSSRACRRRCPFSTSGHR